MIGRMCTPKSRSGSVTAPAAVVEAWKAGGARKRDLVKQFMAAKGKDMRACILNFRMHACMIVPSKLVAA